MGAKAQLDYYSVPDQSIRFHTRLGSECGFQFDYYRYYRKAMGRCVDYEVLY